MQRDIRAFDTARRDRLSKFPKEAKGNGIATSLVYAAKVTGAMEVSIQSSISNHSANSELEKDISDLDVSDKKNGLNGSANINNISSEKLNTLKKRISSSKTPNRTRETTKAKRVRFFRNGDKFWTGYLVAVSNERYK